MRGTFGSVVLLQLVYHLAMTIWATNVYSELKNDDQIYSIIIETTSHEFDSFVIALSVYHLVEFFRSNLLLFNVSVGID